MIGFLGGTGPEGRGLALRFALAGESVIIGSRDRDRADQAAESIARYGGEGAVRGGLNLEAATQGDRVLYESSRGPEGGTVPRWKIV